MTLVGALLRQFGGNVVSAPAAPTLSFADNADGTGAVVTIAGSAAGSTNTVYVADWTGGFIPAAYVSRGSRTGDGTVSLAIANGYHWGYVSSATTGGMSVSAVYGFRSTSGAVSVFEQCLNAVLAKMQSLTLTGLAAANMKISKFPWRRILPTPADGGAVISPLRDSLQPVTSGQNDLAYEVLVTIWKPANQDLTANITNHLNWRQTAMDAFQVVSGQAALAGVSGIYNVEVIPGIVFDEASFMGQYDAEQFTLRCFHRRNRGLV